MQTVPYSSSPFLIVAGAVDPDAQAYFTASGVSDPAQQSAINTLVTDLKSAGLWAAWKAIYPIAGASAAAHSYNLKDPRPAAAAFQLLFAGAVQHTGNGIKFTAGASANTQLVQLDHLAIDSLALPIYLREPDTLTQRIWGSTGGGNLQVVYVNGSALMVWDCYGAGGQGRNAATMTAANSFGLLGFNRSSATQSQIFRNGALVQEVVVPGGSNIDSPGTGPLLIGEATSAQVAFAAVGPSLSAAQQTQLNTIVQNYQAAMGRAI